MTHDIAMRASIRHPAKVPVELYASRKRTLGSLCDVSLGGLSCNTLLPFRKGSRIKLKIMLVRPVFETPAKVIWCSEQDKCFRIGVQFVSSKDAVRMRLVDQLCQIEEYRRLAFDQQGRILTAEQAASEWLSRCAPDAESSSPER